MVMILAGIVAGIGHGFKFRGWIWPSLVLLAISLYFHNAVDREHELRLSPWMRDREVAGASAFDSPTVALRPLRAELSRRVGLGLDESCETVSLNRAILLGERTRMSKEKKQIFIESGTIHVFAISGLHVMIVAKIFMFVVALCGVPLRGQGLVALPFVWLYVALIGGTPSAVRAALMATFYFAAPVCWRRPNGVLAWAQTFILVHVLNPAQIGDVGSQLSFTVMLAIILASRFARHAFSPCIETLFIAFAAWAAGAPIAAMVFGRFTPGGLLAGLALIGTAGYSVVTGVIGVLTSFVSERLAVHFNNLSALMTDAMVIVADGVSRLPGANFDVEQWGWLACAVWYAGFALILLAVRRRALRRRSILD